MHTREVQFCYMIATGDPRAKYLPVSNLVPPKDVYKQGSFKYNAAIFLMWAATQEPQTVIEALQRLYLKEKQPTKLLEKTYDPENMRKGIRDRVFPEVSSSFIAFMHNFAYLAGSLKSQRTEKEQFEVISSDAAIQLILSDRYFDHLGKKKRELAETIRKKLQSHDVELQHQVTLLAKAIPTKQTHHEQPKTIQHLMSMLNSAQGPSLQMNSSLRINSAEDSEDKENYLSFDSKAFLPSSSAAQVENRLADFAKQLTQSKSPSLTMDSEEDKLLQMESFFKRLTKLTIQH